MLPTLKIEIIKSPVIQEENRENQNREEAEVDKKVCDLTIYIGWLQPMSLQVHLEPDH